MKLSRELSEDSFNRFLSLLDTDRERAGAEYEILHRKLVRFFEWRECYNGEELADETVNRIARKLAEGHEFSGNPIDFIFGVARFVLKEFWKVRQAVEIDPEIEMPAPQNDGNAEQVHSCLDRCLVALYSSEREMVLRFYHFEGRAKIVNRQRLAEDLNIPMNALRIRVHRVRNKLKSCVTSCVQGEIDS